MICEWCKGVCFLCFCQMFQKLKGDRKNFSVSNFGWWIELPAWCMQTRVHDPVIYTNFVWLLLTWIGGCFSTQSSSHKWLFRRANAVWIPICGQQTFFLWFQGGKKQTNINCSHSQKSVICGFGCVSRTPWQKGDTHWSGRQSVNVKFSKLFLPKPKYEIFRSKSEYPHLARVVSVCGKITHTMERVIIVSIV